MGFMTVGLFSTVMFAFVLPLTGLTLFVLVAREIGAERRADGEGAEELHRN